MGAGASVTASPDPLIGTWFARDGKLYDVTRYKGLPDEEPLYLICNSGEKKVWGNLHLNRLKLENLENKRTYYGDMIGYSTLQWNDGDLWLRLDGFQGCWATSDGVFETLTRADAKADKQWLNRISEPITHVFRVTEENKKEPWALLSCSDLTSVKLYVLIDQNEEEAAESRELETYKGKIDGYRLHWDDGDSWILCSTYGLIGTWVTKDSSVERIQPLESRKKSRGVMRSDSVVGVFHEDSREPWATVRVVPNNDKNATKKGLNIELTTKATVESPEEGKFLGVLQGDFITFDDGDEWDRYIFFNDDLVANWISSKPNRRYEARLADDNTVQVFDTENVLVGRLSVIRDNCVKLIRVTSTVREGVLYESGIVWIDNEESWTREEDPEEEKEAEGKEEEEKQEDGVSNEKEEEEEEAKEKEEEEEENPKAATRPAESKVAIKLKLKKNKIKLKMKPSRVESKIPVDVKLKPKVASTKPRLKKKIVLRKKLAVKKKKVKITSKSLKKKKIKISSLESKTGETIGVKKKLPLSPKKNIEVTSKASIESKVSCKTVVEEESKVPVKVKVKEKVPVKVTVKKKKSIKVKVEVKEKVPVKVVDGKKKEKKVVEIKKKKVSVKVEEAVPKSSPMLPLPTLSDLVSPNRKRSIAYKSANEMGDAIMSMTNEQDKMW